MIETLSLGGGIIYIKDQFDAGSYYDLGFCPEFTLNVKSEQVFKDEYFSDASGNLIKMPSAIGKTTSLMTDGTFICESLSRSLLQSIWFQGDSADTGTELAEAVLVPVIKSVKFVSSSLVGPDYCVILPAVNLSIPSAISFISNDWKAVNFVFSVVYATNISTVPTLRVQEEGETLTDFCT